jgi:hypothetical protein
MFPKKYQLDGNRAEIVPGAKIGKQPLSPPQRGATIEILNHFLRHKHNSALLLVEIAH